MATTTPQSGRRPALDATPLFAVVGVTDLAVARVRSVVAGATAAQAEAQKQAHKALSEFDPKTAATAVPNRAAAVALEVASKGQQQYEDFAARGRTLVERVRAQRSTQDLLNQAGNTLSRTRGAVTTARRAADDTLTQVRGTVTTGRREAAAVADTTTQRAGAATTTTKRAAKKTTTRAKKDATATKSAAKGVRTSTAKSATAAKKAAADTASKVGD